MKKELSCKRENGGLHNLPKVKNKTKQRLSIKASQAVQSLDS